MNLRDYLRVLRRQKWIVIVVALVCTIGAVVFSLASPEVYASSADVVVTNPQPDSIFSTNSSSGVDAARQILTQIEVLKSRPIEQAVDRRLRTRAGLVRSVDITGVGQTDVIRVTAQSTDPRVARDAANAYANVYLENRRTQAVNSLLDEGKQIQAKIGDLQGQIDTLAGQITALGPAAAAQNLSAQRDALVSQQALLRQKLDQVQVDAALRRGGAEVVASADLPRSPVAPTPLRNGLLGLAFGLILGVSLAFLLDYLDDSIKTSDDLERCAPGIALLAAIPFAGGGRNDAGTGVMALDQPTSAAAESYRALRTSIQLVGLRQPVQSLLVTSAAKSEGKSTTAANLAITFAMSGQKVLLLDLDLRSPHLAELFGLSSDVDLTSVMLGDVPLWEALCEIPATYGSLSLLPAGTPPPNPSELLGSEWMADLMRSARAEADVIVIDSPPLSAVTDALVLTRWVDGVILVGWPGRTRQRLLARAVHELEQSEAPVIGIVLNAVKKDYGYGYGYGYETAPATGNPRQR